MDEDQEVIRNVCGGTPDLFTGQNPPSVSTHGFGAQSAEDVVEKLKAIGADVSIQEAIAITGEVAQNGPELKRMFSTIESLASLFK